MMEVNIDKKRIIITAGIISLFIFSLLPGVYFYSKYQTSEKLLRQYPLLLQDDPKAIIRLVGQLIDLPQDEEPILATVTDVDQVKNQAFFAKAKNGDKVLIYNKAQKAILYDPVANKILEVGPLINPPSPTVLPETQEQTSSPSATLSPTPSTKSERVYKVTFYNGTQTVGLTGVIANILKDKMPDLEIIAREDANKKDYAKTQVIDLTGSSKEKAEEIARILSAEVSALPSEERKPEESDFLIIVGADQK